MPTPVISIRVFLASPGDVSDEREAVRQAAAELNESLRKHGFEIEILGWEQRGPAAGRAQADIDKDVTYGCTSGNLARPKAMRLMTRSET
jgi:hypothetical protein